MSGRDSRQTLHQRFTFCSLVLVVLLIPTYIANAKTAVLQDPTTKSLPDPPAQVAEESEAMAQLRKSLLRLAREVEMLAKRVNTLEKERLFDVTRVLLVGEEQRAEALQSRLRENSERLLALQIRLDQVDSQLKPENIERLFIGVGLVRPEEARDTVRRKLTLERQALLAQHEMLRQERNRFQSALATADVAMQRLRLRLAEAGR